MTVDTTSKAKQNDFHIERSRFLDAFAALEEAVKRLPADAPINKDIGELRAVRNDLVHAQLKFGQIDGHYQASVVNSQKVASPFRQARLFKIDELRWLSQEAARLRQRAASA